MCGIAGFLTKNTLINKDKANVLLSQMIDVLEHRGPDNKGRHIKINADYLAALGHTRLSIIDLSEKSNQPIIYNNLSIIFNGEIYNYIEIKEILQNNGYKFTTSGDTEVALKAFDFWGIEFLEKINGMYSICILDSNSNNLYLIRDRFGVKPLLYINANKTIFFSSEARSFFNLSENIPLNISENSFYEYMRFGFVSNPETIVSEINQVRPSCYLKINLNSFLMKEIKYWSIENESKKYLNMSKNNKIKFLDDIFSSTSELRLRSDVKNSIFLSGGIDSGLISYFASRLNLDHNYVTMKFDDNQLDESMAAIKVADKLNLKHNLYYPKLDEYLEAIDSIQDIWDRPIADPSIIPTFLICRYASKNSKVVLSADGGDELFLGYNKYRVLKLFNLIKQKSNSYFFKIPHFNYNFLPFKIHKKISILNKFNSDLMRFAFLSEQIDYDQMNKIISLDLSKLSKEYIQKQKLNLQNYNKINFSLFDIHNFLTDDILYKIDGASMYNSIENREPMLDYRLASFAYSLPTSDKIGILSSKKIIRNFYKKKIDIQNSRISKKGFVAPLTKIFRNYFKEQIIDFISHTSINKVNGLRSEEVIKIRDKYLSGDNNQFKIIWTLFIYFKWYNKWLKS